MIYSTTSENAVEGTRYIDDDESRAWMKEVARRARQRIRAREVDAAVREGMRRRAEILGEDVPEYLADYANITGGEFVGPKLSAAIRQAWREQHA